MIYGAERKNLSKFTSNNIQSYSSLCVHTHTWPGVCQRPAANGLTASQHTAGAQITRRLQFATRRSKKLIATHVKKKKENAKKGRRKKVKKANAAAPEIWITLTAVRTFRADMQIPETAPIPNPTQPILCLLRLARCVAVSVSYKCLRVCDKFCIHRKRERRLC